VVSYFENLTIHQNLLRTAGIGGSSISNFSLEVSAKIIILFLSCTGTKYRNRMSLRWKLCQFGANHCPSLSIWTGRIVRANSLKYWFNLVLKEGYTKMFRHNLASFHNSAIQVADSECNIDTIVAVKDLI